MNVQRFDELMKLHGDSLGQEGSEWRCFIEYADAFFKARHVIHPLVVEIGVMNNAQKPFYVEILNAEHVGIDINANAAAEIVGNSCSLGIKEKLHNRIVGRQINLLFIDGDHTYKAVKSDYEMYGPLTQHIIALHDISHPFSPQIPEETMRLWKEIVASDKRNTLLSIQRHNSMTTGITAGRQMGIGLVVKEGK